MGQKSTKRDFDFSQSKQDSMKNGWRSNGMPRLFPKHSRFIIRWQDTVRKKTRLSIPWSNNKFCIIDIASSNFHKRHKQASSIQLKSPQRYFHRVCLQGGGGWKGESTRGRCRRTEKHHVQIGESFEQAKVFKAQAEPQGLSPTEYRDEPR